MKKKVIFIIFLLIFLSADPAMANEPPSAQSALAMIMILPLMAFFSLIGGAYPIMARYRKAIGCLTFGAAIIAIFFALAFEPIAFIVTIIFGIYAIIRGFQMLLWGFVTLFSKGKPKDLNLIGAKPWRLIPAGCFILLVTVSLCGMMVAYHKDLRSPYWWLRKEKREEVLKEFIGYQLAHARIQKSRGELSLFDKIPKNDPKYLEFFDISSSAIESSSKIFTLNVDTEYDKEGKHFTIYMLPEPDTFWPFPFSYIFPKPSFRADDTGKIRMVHVSKVDHRCPADAPVVDKIGEKDIQRAWVKYFKGIDSPNKIPVKVK